MATTRPTDVCRFLQYRNMINKGDLHTLDSLLVRMTHNSHPFLFFSLEGRSFLWSFLPSGSHVTSRGISRYTAGSHMISRGISRYTTGNHVTFHGISEIYHCMVVPLKIRLPMVQVYVIPCLPVVYHEYTKQ